MQVHTVEGGEGFRLHVREWGDPQEPFILLIRGWSQNHLSWKYQFESELANEFRLVALDNRGHGMSEKPLEEEHYTDERLWAEDIAAVISALDLTRPMLVGWSYGGHIISDYVRAHGGDRGDQLRGQGDGAQREPGQHRVRVHRQRRGGNRAGPAHQHLGHAQLRPGLHRGADGCRGLGGDPVLQHRRPPSGATDDDLLPPHGLRRRPLQDDGTGAGHARGSRHRGTPVDAEHVLGVCPTTEASWYEGIGHAPFLEDPERFNQELADFTRRANA